MLVCGGAGAGVAAVVGPAHAWVTDGDVLAITSAGGSTYVGGDFRLIGRSTGSWAEVDSAGAVGAIRAVVRGSVADAVADGRGGWFLRGDISAVGGVDVGKTEVVHLRANGRLDPDWSIRTDGDIHTMARAGDRLYVGGSFSQLDGTAAEIAGCDPCPLRSAARLGPQGRRTDEERRGSGGHDRGDVRRERALHRGGLRPRRRRAAEVAGRDRSRRRSTSLRRRCGATRALARRRRMRKSSAPASRSWSSIRSGVRSTWPATSKCSAVQSVRGSEPSTRGPDGSAPVESRLRRGRVGHRRGSGRLSGVRRRRVRVDRRQVASRAGCGRRPPRIGDALGPRSGRGSPHHRAGRVAEGRLLRRRVRFRRRHRPNQPRRRGHAHRVGDVMGCPRRGHGRRCRPPAAPEPSRSEGRSSRSGHCDGTASQR